MSADTSDRSRYLSRPVHRKRSISKCLCPCLVLREGLLPDLFCHSGYGTLDAGPSSRSACSYRPNSGLTNLDVDSLINTMRQLGVMHEHIHCQYAAFVSNVVNYLTRRCRYQRSTWSTPSFAGDASSFLTAHLGSPHTPLPSRSGSPKIIPNLVARKISLLFPDRLSLKHSVRRRIR